MSEHPPTTGEPGGTRRSRASSRALGTLFTVLTVLFVGIAYAAFASRVWPVAFAAAVLAAWLSTMAFRGLRR